MQKPLLAISAALLLAGCATMPNRDESAAAVEEVDKRPFIERSLVLVPEQVGEFRLGLAEDYPGRPEMGAGMRFEHPDFPDVLINLFVYPIGRIGRDTALDQGMSDFRAELSAVAEQGRYTDLVIGEEVAFNLDAVAADGQALPATTVPPPGEAKAPGTYEEKMLAAVEAAEAALDPAIGRKLPIRMVREGEPLDSAAFLFYRGLYLYKGRISASAKAMPPENFHRFANHAMARLVPAVNVRSTGGCHSTTILLDPDATPAQMQQQLAVGAARSLAQSRNENCEAQLDTAVPPGHRAIALEYPPSMWR